MSAHHSLFEVFLLRFEALRNVAKNEPQRVTTFYSESQAMRDAVADLQSFLVRTDFERRVYHGPRKLIPQAPEVFETRWNEYCSSWLPAIVQLYQRPETVTR